MRAAAIQAAAPGKYRMRYRDIIVEKVVGRLAVVYHRTKHERNIAAITQMGVRRGAGGLYGDGLYATYDFDSQRSRKMVETYGPYIIKMKVSLTDFLILDRDVARVVYGGTDILRQVEANPNLRKWQPARRRELAEKIEAMLATTTDGYTSDTAERIMSDAHAFAGMVYTGRQDGRCIVSYDLTHIVPVAWAYYPVEELQKEEGDLDWKRVGIETIRRTTKMVRANPALSGDIGNIVRAVAARKITIDGDEFVQMILAAPFTPMLEALMDVAADDNAAPIFDTLGASPQFRATFTAGIAILLLRRLKFAEGLIHHGSAAAKAFATKMVEALVEAGLAERMKDRYQGDWKHLLGRFDLNVVPAYREMMAQSQ